MSASTVFPNIELFHVHIPKTAGTSLNASLEEAYGQCFANHDPERIRNDSRVRAAAAHTTYHNAKLLFPNARLITVVRDPVSRFKSTLRHLHARRNWPNYSDIGPIINSLIDEDGYVHSNENILTSHEFVQRFDNLIVRYLSKEPVTANVNQWHLQMAVDALPDFYQVLNQNQFTNDVELLFSNLGFSNIATATSNQAKSKIPLWENLPESLEPFLESDIALYNTMTG